MEPVETFWSTASPIDHTTRFGGIRGLSRDGVAVFRGMPYAAAPVGDLRFAAPQRHPWAHQPNFDATRWGATPQRVSPGWGIPEPSVPGADTLNLNVFAPTATLRDGAALPVLVWIHGGGYTFGSAIGNWYDGRTLAQEGIITVSISYRLGVDGFAHLDDAVDNRAVLDWIAALEWVQDHIAEFGGDPSRVTIAGQSAGAGAALALLATRRARGLFQRVWSMSGVLDSFGVDDAAARTARLSASLGLARSDTAHYGALSDQFLEQTLVALPEDIPFAPVVGEDLFPDGIPSGIQAHSDVPLVLGATADEGTWNAEEPRIEPDAARAMLAEFGVADIDAREFVSRAEGTTALTLSRIKSELYFRSTVVEVRRRRAEAAHTRVYDYTWGPAALGGLALHCNEIPLFFGTHDEPSAQAVLGTDIPDEVRGFHDDVRRFILGEDAPANDAITVYGPGAGDGFHLAAPLAARWDAAGE